MRTYNHPTSDADVSDLKAAFVLSLAEDTSVNMTLLDVISAFTLLATPPADILLAGHVVRLIHAGDREVAAFPSFDDLIGMIIDGVRLSIALVALQLPAVDLAIVFLPGLRLLIMMLPHTTNSMIPGSSGVTAFGTAGLVAAGLVSFLGSYLSPVTTAASTREVSLTAVISATCDLASDRLSVRVASTVAFVVFVTRPLVALCTVVPVVGTLLAVTASFFLLVVSATLLGRGAPNVSSSGADATRESHADGVNVGSMELAGSVPPA